VHAFRGEVEVSDFRAGQRVLIVTGQTAKTSIHAVAGLSLRGRFEKGLSGWSLHDSRGF